MAEPQSAALLPSQRIDRWLPSARFRESVTVPSSASPERLLEAVEEASVGDIPVAAFLRLLRGLPANIALEDAPGAGPFLGGLASAGIRVIERAPDEIVLGTENLVMSVRAVRRTAGATLLVFEHATNAADAAPFRFRDLSLMRPSAARKTRRLLGAIVRRAERPSQAARLRSRRREEALLGPRPAFVRPTTHAPG